MRSRDWEFLGENDPYFAILSEPIKQYGKWDEAEFYATGEQEIAAVLDKIQRLGIAHGRNSALDFGCGAGRLTRALESRFVSCTGVDISAPMLDRARLNSSATFIHNERPELRVFKNDSFDFIYSRLVLQHMPSLRLALTFISEFVRILTNEGLAVFQVPSSIFIHHKIQPKYRLFRILSAAGLPSDFLYERLHLTPIRMRQISLAAVKNAVAKSGGELVHVESHEDKGCIHSLCFVRKL